MGKRGNARRRERMRKCLAATEHECWLCLEPLDMAVPAGNPLAVEIDEEIPVSRGGDPLSLRNVHLVHRMCNLRKGDRILPKGFFAKKGGMAVQEQPKTSRNWFGDGDTATSG